ncbi:MAG: FliG C-terminal domain-containing protein [Planctomycetota bacterium]|nr:FliG C-terminal domain-containing protein [Planctomycetota bacterium]
MTGRQKAAMLLMSLDAATAAELVRGLDAEVVQELAVELAYLDATGLRSSEQSAEIVQQFCSSLQGEEPFHFGSFLNAMLNSTLGDERAGQIQTEIQGMLQKRDPFLSIRSVDPQTMASALEGEHPQAAAVVLSELPARKSSEVIGLLGESVRASTISRMTSCDTVTAEAKARIAETICRRLDVVTSAGAGGASEGRPEQSLRKVAVILRNLGKEVRDGLMSAIEEKDGDVAEMVGSLMVIWEDIPQVVNRSLQEALRGIDAKKLALALSKADEEIVEKIKSNISERAAATVDEEASLMSSPKMEDIEGARAEIVRILREMNENGELAFVEE